MFIYLECCWVADFSYFITCFCFQGYYGRVLKGKYYHPNGEIRDVAIKVLKDKHNDLKQELEVMAHLKHDNIVQLIGHYFDNEGEFML